jgi:ribose 5-phosphate isomerase B
MKSKVLTESDVRSVAEGSRLYLPPRTIVTPSARDLAAARHIEICRLTEEAASRTIAVAADHAGFEMKEQLKDTLTELGYTYYDFGTYSQQPVDYPDVAFKVAEAVSSGRFPRGIIIDGAGIGSCMTANKVPGVRAAACHDIATARNSREHNDANVLTLGAGIISPELMREIVQVWLSTEVGAERHRRRVEKIMAIERKFLARDL